MVVLAIVGLLASVVLVSLGSARSRGRDTRRVQDIKNIKTALELYYETCTRYPANLSTLTAGACAVAVNGEASPRSLPNPPLRVVPTDPGTGAYKYASYGAGPTGSSLPCGVGGYHLGATLDNASAVPANDGIDSTTATAGQDLLAPVGQCTGSQSSDFRGDGDCNLAGPPEKCYDYQYFNAGGA